MYSDDDNQKTMTPAEARLERDRLFGALDYPDSGSAADAYFREGFALIRTVNQPDKVRSVLKSYLGYVQDADLRAEIESFLSSLESNRGK
jgi:hypothetical protein